MKRLLNIALLVLAVGAAGAALVYLPAADLLFPAVTPRPPKAKASGPDGYIPDIIVASDGRAAQSTAVAMLPAPPKLDIAVESLAPADFRPLGEWQIFGAQADAGWFDTVKAPTAGFAPGETVTVDTQGTLTATGWAGDGVLGVRFPYVLLALCGQVIASVPVGDTRTDVAKAVHPNLEKSGWRARIFAGELPHCDDMTLQAYGVAAARRIIFPLQGKFTLAVTQSVSTADVSVRHGAAAARPENIPEAPPSIVVTTAAARTNLRRCGDVKCEVVGFLATGRHTVALLDQAAQWMLVAGSGGAGWVSRDAARQESPAPPARPQPPAPKPAAQPPHR